MLGTHMQWHINLLQSSKCAEITWECGNLLLVYMQANQVATLGFILALGIINTL